MTSHRGHLASPCPIGFHFGSMDSILEVWQAYGQMMVTELLKMLSLTQVLQELGAGKEGGLLVALSPSFMCLENETDRKLTWTQT